MGVIQGSKLQGMFLVQFIILLFVLLFTGIFNLKTEGMKNSKRGKPPPKMLTCKNNNKFLVLIFFLMIPVITGVRQFITIVFRGIKGMLSRDPHPKIRILFTTIFIMLLVLFNINLLTNIGNRK
jgi:hypothetical protein